MATNSRQRIRDPRTFGTASIVGVILGLAMIAIGGPAYTTVGVVTIILGAICLLLAVGSYLDDSGRAVGE